ncbi:ELWxxDGT repeat protein [Aquimarina rubra]|uniref:ELWxxDGT repeat protein n=1 Tax=Aquimarina rubra TaxID=1920033 RepID=A0ABW5LE46_9FLAO
MKKRLLLLILLCPLLSFSQFRLIKDIIVGTNSSNPYNFIEFNGKFYFTTDVVNSGTDDQCFESDGTTLGTFSLKDQSGNTLLNGNAATNGVIPIDWEILGNELLFSAQDLVNGPELYKISNTDSTAELVLDMRSSGGSNPFEFTPINNTLIFSANDGVNGRELWVTDGTTSGTQILKDIASGNASSSPQNFFVYGNTVYFTANDNVNGNELWVTDGTTSGTQLLKDIAAGAAPSGTRDFIGFNGKVYFTADDGVSGRELWVTDGTNAGTKIVQDLNAGLAGSEPDNLIVFNDNLVFSANVPSVGIELVKMNPSESISSLGNINPTGDSEPLDLTVFNGMLYFSATNGTSGRELYSTNGFQSGTGIVSDINASGSSNPENFLAYNGKLYFSADDGTSGPELWAYDDTNGTVLIQDLVVGALGSSPVPELVYENEMILTINDPSNTGRELWAYIDPSFQTFVPDDNFEQALIDLGYDTTLDDNVNTGNINGITTLSIDGSSAPVSDFTGLEAFKSLQNFTTTNNSEASLDLTENSNLTDLTVFIDQNINNIIVSPTFNTHLTRVTYALGNLSNLNLSDFETLENVNIQGDSNLISIDISNCSSSNLTMDISNVSSLTAIDVTNASALRQLFVTAGGAFTSIDVSTAVNLTDIGIINSGLQTLDLTSNTLLDRVLVQNNQLTSLNVKNGNNTILVDFNALGNINLGCIEVDNETDANSESGAYSSWLKDGSAIYSENCATLSVDENVSQNIDLYPNPANNYFVIKNNTADTLKVEIFDLNGRIIKSFEEYKESYNISELPSGLYLLNLTTDGSSYTYKLLKN